MARRSTDNPPRPLLRRRERQVLHLLAQGRTEREAASELHFSYAYTRELAAAACRTLGARNTRNAIYLATRGGLI